MEIRLNEITYQVIRTRDFEHQGVKRTALFLRRPQGQRLFTAIKYENGAYSSVVPVVGAA